jgi:hypothetical protein
MNVVIMMEASQWIRRFTTLLAVIFQREDEIGAKFQPLPHVFGVQQLNADSLNVMQPNRKSASQDVSHQTGSTYISACRWDI